MSSSFNSIHLVGNLGRDPELRYTPNGTPVAQFTIATNEKIKKHGEELQLTTWFRVTCFGKQAETVTQYLTKGRSCYVLGRLRVEDWKDRDNKDRYTLEVTADRVQFLGSKDDREDRESFEHDQSRANTSGTETQEPTDDDIPF